MKSFEPVPEISSFLSIIEGGKAGSFTFDVKNLASVEGALKVFAKNYKIKFEFHKVSPERLAMFVTGGAAIGGAIGSYAGGWKGLLAGMLIGGGVGAVAAHTRIILISRKDNKITLILGETHV